METIFHLLRTLSMEWNASQWFNSKTKAFKPNRSKELKRKIERKKEYIIQGSIANFHFKSLFSKRKQKNKSLRNLLLSARQCVCMLNNVSMRFLLLLFVRLIFLFYCQFVFLSARCFLSFVSS